MRAPHSSTCSAVRLAPPALGRRVHVLLACLLGVFALSAPIAGHTQTAVRDLDNPARQPFQTQIVDQILDENAPPRNFLLVTVPQGKRLVIEHVSLRIVVPPTSVKQSLVRANLKTQVNAQTVDHVLTMRKVPELDANTAELFEASQQIRAYADPGNSVSTTITFRTASTVPPDDVERALVQLLSISGYFVDVN